MTQGRITAVALGIIDQEGLQAVTMRRLGEELGIDSMALYRHFPDKRAILQQVVHSAMEGIRYPDESADWRENLRSVAVIVRNRLLAHPNLLPLMFAPAFLAETLLDPRASGVVELQAAGMDAVAARCVMHLLASFVLGHCFLITGLLPGMVVNEGSFDVSASPGILQPGSESGGADDWEALSFESGLASVLKGAERLIEGES